MSQTGFNLFLADYIKFIHNMFCIDHIKQACDAWSQLNENQVDYYQRMSRKRKRERDYLW